jgi:hypothetical protein
MTAPLNCEALHHRPAYDLQVSSRARATIRGLRSCRIEYADLKGVRKTSPRGRSSPRTKAFRLPVGGRRGVLLGIGLASGRSLVSLPLHLPSCRVRRPLPQQALPHARFVANDELQNILKSQESLYQAEIVTCARLTQSPNPPGARAASISATVERPEGQRR